MIDKIQRVSAVTGCAASTADEEKPAPSISGSASIISTVVPKKASPSISSSASTALSQDEVAQLHQELAILQEQPRSQMVCHACCLYRLLVSRKHHSHTMQQYHSDGKAALNTTRFWALLL